MQFAIFDLDHTLLPFDSDKAWNQFLVDQGYVDRDDYEHRNARFYQDYLEARLDIHAYQAFACEVLQTFPVELVTSWRDQYIKDIVVPELQTKALDCIQEYKHNNFQTLIISATNTFIVEPIAALHDVDAFLGCEFEMIEGAYTGRLVGIPTYREGKIQALEAWLNSQGVEATTIHFYSDSINDVPLLDYADQAFVVDPDPSLAALAKERGWPVVDFAN
jgi:HAD superfamily hydrolase (TIGR01490 family)